MVNGNDPVESFFNSIELVKNALSPLESSFRKATKDLDHCFSGSKNGANNLKLAKGNVSSQVQQLSLKNGQGVVSDEIKKGLFIEVPLKTFLGMFAQNHKEIKVELSKKGLEGVDNVKEDGTCTNLDQFVVSLSLFVNGFVQAFHSPFKTGKKRFQKKTNEEKLVTSFPPPNVAKPKVLHEMKHKDSKDQFVTTLTNDGLTCKEGRNPSLECLIGFYFHQLAQHLHKFELGALEASRDCCNPSSVLTTTNHFDHFKAVTNILEGKKADFSGFLGNLKFARVGGAPSSMINVTSAEKEENDEGVNSTSREEIGGNSPQNLANSLLSIPLSNVERLRSTLSTVSLTELIELVPQLGRSSSDHPDKKKLISVQDFFRYTECEGKRFFEELDRDGDGQVTLDDLESATRKRKLPRRYANDFMRQVRSHLFAKSFGWKQFLSLMEQKEPTILRAYTSLCLSKSGTLKKGEILASLKNAGLPANEDNALAMMRFLNSDTEEFISYGHFRNFMLLLPSERLQEDSRMNAATVVAVPPPVEIPAESVLKSALAGGLSCAFSAALMHPIDTIKTQVQASTLSFPEIILKLPEIGVRGVYRGSIPAIIGQFSSHGLRTGIYEATKLVLINFAPNLPDIQVQSVASFCSTVLGTAARIPCEVIKQRCQAGIFNNAGEALICTWREDGLKGFFRGTGLTICREVPFYVAGMGLYAESKKVVQRLVGRELEPWETILVGAISGGLAAITTTPFDVLKTRMMTAPQGKPISMSIIALSILRHEGPLGLFKGAVPRFFWVAPLGAINFAGYELLRNAMNKNEQTIAQLSEES